MVNSAFPYASLFAVSFEECKMTGSSLAEADASALTVQGGAWSLTDLHGLKLARMEWRGVSLAGADLRECDLSRSRFLDCDLSSAQLTNADLRESDLRGSRMDGVDFPHIRMKNTKIDLEQAVLLAESMGARFQP